MNFNIPITIFIIFIKPGIPILAQKIWPHRCAGFAILHPINSDLESADIKCWIVNTAQQKQPEASKS
jgi:hypothetical protein